MNLKLNWLWVLFVLIVVMWLSTPSSLAADKKIAHPPDIQLEASANTITVTWDASPEEAERYFIGYSLYFNTKASAHIAPEEQAHAIHFKKNVHNHVIKGLENGQEYFVHVLSRQGNTDESEAGILEKSIRPQADGKSFALNIFDFDADIIGNNCSYGWNRKNGQDIPGNHRVMTIVKYIDILMIESPTSKGNSLFISPSDADVTKDWPTRNTTLVADIGKEWNVTTDATTEIKFSTSAVIKVGHVYILKTFDDYHIKLQVKSIKEVNWMLPYGSERGNVDLNKSTFIYTSQFGKSYEDFITGTTL